mmetsp:Transcript_1594/g.4009  ORF Transcript_1594/g.4009 Transcript_1594/m.4009 type:complete len:151 (-) Transcript_1594:127-579(-)
MAKGQHTKDDVSCKRQGGCEVPMQQTDSLFNLCTLGRGRNYASFNVFNDDTQPTYGDDFDRRQQESRQPSPDEPTTHRTSSHLRCLLLRALGRVSRRHASHQGVESRTTHLPLPTPTFRIVQEKERVNELPKPGQVVENNVPQRASQAEG